MCPINDLFLKIAVLCPIPFCFSSFNIFCISAFLLSTQSHVSAVCLVSARMNSWSPATLYMVIESEAPDPRSSPSATNPRESLCTPCLASSITHTFPCLSSRGGVTLMSSASKANEDNQEHSKYWNEACLSKHCLGWSLVQYFCRLQELVLCYPLKWLNFKYKMNSSVLFNSLLVKHNLGIYFCYLIKVENCWCCIFCSDFNSSDGTFFKQLKIPILRGITGAYFYLIQENKGSRGIRLKKWLQCTLERISNCGSSVSTQESKPYSKFYL